MYVLRSPSGKLIEETAKMKVEDAQAEAFHYLNHKKWAQNYWKDWDGFIQARQKRGWFIVSVKMYQGGWLEPRLRTLVPFGESGLDPDPNHSDGE